YSQALAQAQARVAAPETTPSSQVLRTMVEQYDSSFLDFTLAQSELARETLLNLPWTAEQQAKAEAQAVESIAAQREREAADTLPFEEWRQRYMAPQGLG
ncbi:MAG: glutamate--cysteine ligase, partial [Comamonas sp.]